MKVTNKKRFILFIFLAALLIFCLSAFFYLSFYIKGQLFTAVAEQGEEQSFEIEKGSGVKEIGHQLAEAGLIKSETFFEYYVWFKDWSGNLQAGQYQLSPTMTLPEIARKIAGGEANSEEIQITIPEGFNLAKIDQRLAKAGLIEAGELAKQSQLEGYLFPDTYRFQEEESLEEIINKMRANFVRKLNDELREEIDNQGKTIEKIITMASLLEKEVSNERDRKIVSGIFWQRLADKYPLQSCATIAYILDVDKWRYSIEDTEIDSAYNTYQNIGLPPGPICNPGLSAIQAAIYPEKTDYYFFLSSPEGETIFSKTLEEHNQNKVKYLES